MKNIWLNNPALLKILLIAGVLIAIVLIAVAVVLLVKPRKRSEEELDGRAASWLAPAHPGMLASFRAARKRLREKLASSRFLYQVPWYLLVGELDSGKTALAGTLAGAGADSVGTGGEAPHWLLLDTAVLIDLPGAAFLAPDEAAGKPAAGGEAAKTTESKAPATAGESSQQAWRTFLKLAARFRPRQPLNGVVLAVSARELLEAAANPEFRDRPRRLAALARRFADMQRLTGLRLPVYVVVTKCDAVPGFGSFARTVFESSAAGNVELSNEVFGWSNPYALESDYSSVWVEEAFDETHEMLLQRQLEMMAAATSAETADGVLQLPFEIDRLREPMQALLDVVFRNTAYGSPHLLRGIFFCGAHHFPVKGLLTHYSAEPEDEMAAGAANDTGRSGIVFARGLFESKIFEEQFLATPVRSGYLSGNRSVLLARLTACVLVVLLALGLYRAYNRIAFLEQSTIDPVLHSLTGSLTSLSETSGAEIAPAVNLLNSLGALSDNAYASPAMPYSYLDLDGFRARLQNTLEGIFEVVVLRSCKDALMAKIDRIVEPDEEAPQSSSEAAYPFGNAWTADPAYLALQQDLSDLKALNQNIERYESVSSVGAGSYGELDGLLHYLGGRGIPDVSRFAQDPRYQNLLSKAIADPLSIPATYDGENQEKAKLLIDNFYHSWFDANRLSTEAQSLDGKLQVLDAATMPSNADLLALVNQAQAMDSQLGSGSYDWLAGTFDRANYPALGPQLDQASFATSEFTDRVQVEGVERFTSLQNAIAQYPSIIDVGNGKVRLDPGVHALASVLNTLLGYDWMAAENGGSCRTVARTAAWDQAALTRAAQIETAHAKAVNEILPSLPDAYRDEVQAIVDQRAANAMYLALEESSAAGSGDRASGGLDAELGSFSQSADLLNQIAAGAGTLGRSAATSCIQRLVGAQAESLLVRVNAAASGLFAPAPLAAAGHPDLPVSQWIYGFTTATDLENDLAAEEQSAISLDAGSAPLVKLLRTLGAQNAAIATWQQFDRDASKLAAKTPHSPILELVNYIQSDLDPIDPQHGCGFTAPEGSADRFLNLRPQLAALALSRCKTVALMRYNAIASAFNQLLTGHFPFSENLDTRPGAEADPAKISAFYAVFDHDSQGLDGAIESAAANPAAAQAFLDALAELRPIVLSTANPPAPALSIAVRFGANKERENLADHIAAWTLTLGKQSIASNAISGAALPEWQYGQAVTLNVRYAFDSPILPAAANPSHAAQVQGVSVTYTYNDPWSLMALLADHPPDPGGAQNRYAVVIPNRYVVAHGKSAPPDTTAYMQIELLPAGAKPGAEPLPVPAIPFAAPAVKPQSDLETAQ